MLVCVCVCVRVRACVRVCVRVGTTVHVCSLGASCVILSFSYEFLSPPDLCLYTDLLHTHTYRCSHVHKHKGTKLICIFMNVCAIFERCVILKLVYTGIILLELSIVYVYK